MFHDQELVTQGLQAHIDFRLNIIFGCHALNNFDGNFASKRQLHVNQLGQGGYRHQRFDTEDEGLVIDDSDDGRTKKRIVSDVAVFALPEIDGSDVKVTRHFSKPIPDNEYNTLVRKSDFGEIGRRIKTYDLEIENFSGLRQDIQDELERIWQGLFLNSNPDKIRTARRLSNGPDRIYSERVSLINEYIQRFHDIMGRKLEIRAKSAPSYISRDDKELEPKLVSEEENKNVQLIKSDSRTHLLGYFGSMRVRRVFQRPLTPDEYKKSANSRFDTLKNMNGEPTDMFRTRIDYTNPVARYEFFPVMLADPNRFTQQPSQKLSKIFPYFKCVGANDDFMTEKMSNEIIELFTEVDPKDVSYDPQRGYFSATKKENVEICMAIISRMAPHQKYGFTPQRFQQVMDHYHPKAA